MTTEANTGDRTGFPDSLPRPLRSTEALHDPFEWYDSKRRESPVHYDSQRDVYDVFSYDHVKAVLQDDARFVRKELSRGDMAAENPFSYIDNAMVWSDGPKHKQSKGELFQYFRPDLLVGLRESIEQISASQLETARSDGSTFDFVDDFAVPVPLRVIMDVVGVPREDHQQVLAWLDTFREVMNSEYSAEESTTPSRMEEPVAYFKGLVSARRDDPRDDLLTQLVEQSDLSDAEIGSNCFDFIMAGQGTMSEFLSNALYLFDEYDMLEELDGYDLEVVLEEVLRYRSPLQSRARKSTRTTRVADVDVPEGATVIAWIGAANRDPAQYDRSDAFVPTRDPDHLAFGTGAHTCIGAPLARLQAPIVLRTFFETVDEVELLREEMKPKPKASKLGFEELPVRTTRV